MELQTGSCGSALSPPTLAAPREEGPDTGAVDVVRLIADKNPTESCDYQELASSWSWHRGGCGQIRGRPCRNKVAPLALVAMEAAWAHKDMCYRVSFIMVTNT